MHVAIIEAMRWPASRHVATSCWTAHEVHPERCRGYHYYHSMTRWGVTCDADTAGGNCEVMRETEKQFSPGETRERDHMTARLTWALDTATVQLADRPRASWANSSGSEDIMQS